MDYYIDEMKCFEDSAKRLTSLLQALTFLEVGLAQQCCQGKHESGETGDPPSAAYMESPSSPSQLKQSSVNVYMYMYTIMY